MGYLVATDGSAVSDRAVAHAAAEATVWHRSLTIVHVLTPEPTLLEGELVLPGSETAIATGEAVLAGAADLAGEAAADLDVAAAADGDAEPPVEGDADLPVSTELLAGWPAETITDYADTHPFDGIVVGHRGQSAIAADTLGSVAKRVLDRATVPVTIVK